MSNELQQAVDPLSLCVNANFVAESLDESAEMKHESIGNDAYLSAGPRRWAERLAQWATKDRNTADMIRKLITAYSHLIKGIRDHRDQHGDDRCWEDDAKLYALLGEGEADTALPPKAEFLASCERFYEQRQCPAAKGKAEGKTIAQLEDEIERLQAEVDVLKAGRNGGP
jgi:hypothetical protein